jgi:hypothetical protein
MVEPWSYPPPLDRLFTFGDAEFGTRKEMPDYVAELGLTQEHVPALIEIVRMWEDETEVPSDPAGSAPIHAWRALGQLRAVEAVEPLLNMQNQLDEEMDDWYFGEFQEVFGQIGPPAVPALAEYLANTLNREFPRVSAADGLLRVATRYPESRDEVVEALRRQIARCEEGVYDLNGFLVSHLTELKATEAAEPIERAFAAQVVEDDICGSWGSVRQKLGVPGLGLAPDTPPEPSHRGELARFEGWSIGYDGIDRRRARTAEKKAKTKRKQQEKARKRNRKRR